jgi:colanic acid biosynthesis glycosyl transferase WcaI
MLVCSGEGTPIVDFLSPIGCAKIITDRNIPDRTKAASEYLRQVSKEALSAMGAKGITVIRKEYSSEIVTKRYVELVESVVIKTIGLINSGKR